MTTRFYRSCTLIMVVLLTVTLLLAWMQKRDADSIRAELDAAAMHHVLVVPIDSETGEPVMATMKGPLVGTRYFPVAVDMRHATDKPSRMMLSWYGLPTEVEIAATGYRTERVSVGTHRGEPVTVRMKKAQPAAPPYGAPRAAGER